MATLHKLAVYGTLRRGGHNNPLLENQKFLGTFKQPVPYGLYMSGGLPFIKETPPEDGLNNLVFDVYEVTDEALERVDRLEGHPSWYHRTQVDTPEGRAWIYVMPEHAADRYGHRFVESGDYLEASGY